MAYIFGSIWDRPNRNALNNLSKSVEQHGKYIQNLVAKGQLTPAQYAELISIINSNLKSGEVGKFDLKPDLQSLVSSIPNKINRGEATFNDIDINKGKLLPKHVSEELLRMITGDAPINAVPADGSITMEKLDVNLSGLINDINNALTSENESWVI